MSDMTVQQNGSVQSKSYTARAVAPPVDVYENADELLVIADIPGVSSETVDVRIESGTLTLEARRPPANGGPALAREYEELDFSRSFRIPDGIDAASVSAEAKNGTVVVRLPKSAAVKPRKIVVRGG
jgi:HSP20 family molecular chaperone IbpA